MVSKMTNQVPFDKTTTHHCWPNSANLWIHNETSSGKYRPFEDFCIQETPFGKKYEGSRRETHQERERSLGTPREQFRNTPFEVLPIAN